MESDRPQSNSGHLLMVPHWVHYFFEAQISCQQIANNYTVYPVDDKMALNVLAPS